MTALTTTDVGVNLLRDGNSGANNPLVRYFAVGSGTSTPTTSQTALDDEQFRKAVTSYTNGGAGELVIDVYLSPSDAVGVDIQEVAVFGGSSASPTPNSGVMLGRALYTPSTNPKTNTVSIQLSLDMQYS